MKIFFSRKPSFHPDKHHNNSFIAKGHIDKPHAAKSACHAKVFHTSKSIHAEKSSLAANKSLTIKC